MSAQLPNGLWSDFAAFEDARLKANINFHQLDWTQWKCITKQIALIDRPVSGSVGDAYLVDGTTVHLWYNGAWNIITLHCTFLFYDDFLNMFFVWDGGVVTTLVTYIGLIDNTPVGVIHIFDDYGVLPLPTNYAWCDGSAIVGGPLNGLLTRDLSGMAIVGYGTIGAGDIDTDPYDAVPVGNAANQIALNHTHTVAAHDHTMAHTHAGPSHNHGPGAMEAQFGHDAGSDRWGIKQGSANFSYDLELSGVGAVVQSQSVVAGTQLIGNTANAGTGNTGGASTSTTSSTALTTDSSLSATQNIQPFSAKMRFILKVA